MVQHCDGDISEICFAYSIVGCFYLCCSLPAHCIMCCCPPFAIWLQNIEGLNGYKDRYGIFGCFGKDPQERADPSVQGHITTFWDIPFHRAIVICFILTLLGFFPGVIFAFVMVYRHLFSFLIDSGLCCSCFSNCWISTCCIKNK
eukprot:gene8393-218_t